jgi:CRP/FNR family cyclic AMP-dependent transcriptional regulator
MTNVVGWCRPLWHDVGCVSHDASSELAARSTDLSVGEFISARGRPRSYDTGEPLFHEGDPSVDVYACVSGAVKVYVTVPTGRELMLGFKFPGDAFGELSALDERPRSAGARAAEPSVVSRMSGDDFIDGLREHPDLAISVLRNLATQLRRSNARLSARNSEQTTVRAGHRLLELSGLMMRHSAHPDRIRLSITQGELADWIGSTRESTARALATFRRRGILSTGRGVIVIHDVSALEAAVRSG